MNNTLLIHIGIRKTGSSALQFFLFNNMKKLEEYGWCYPDLKQGLVGIQFLSQQKEINGEVFYKSAGELDTSSENWNKAWEQVLEYLKEKNVIISDERISIWETNRFLEAAKKLYDNIKVIIYLRRQDRAIESLWNQLIKNTGGSFLTFQESIHSNKGIECSHYSHYHYKKQLDEISNIVGKENIIIRIYEKNQLLGTGHTTESDFLSVIGIEPNWKEWNTYPVRNIRLGSNYLEIKRIFNSLQLVEQADLSQEHYKEAFGILSRIFSQEEKENGYFTYEERKKFLEMFREENEAIAREYLHRKDGILFYNENINYTLYEQQATLFEEDMIRIFSLMICIQNKEIQQLKEFNFGLGEKLMMINNIKRKDLVLFGAGQKCKELLERLKSPVVLIIDNNESKSGKWIKGIQIVGAKKMTDWAKYFIIVTCIETDEITEQLNEKGLKKEEDYILAKEYFTYY